MEIKKLREFKIEDLRERVITKKDELVNLVQDVRIGKENNYSKIKELKKEIARIYTIIKNS